MKCVSEMPHGVSKYSLSINVLKGGFYSVCGSMASAGADMPYFTILCYVDRKILRFSYIHN